MQGIRRKIQCIDELVDEEGQPAEEEGGNYQAENARGVARGTSRSRSLRGKKSFVLHIQRNPAIAHFKGLVDFMPYCERCLIANI